MAAGFGNIYRLPQAVILRGGLPFLAVYLGLTIFLGLPLLFLELGIGQLVQEGVIKFWRAVPFFKGKYFNAYRSVTVFRKIISFAQSYMCA